MFLEFALANWYLFAGLVVVLFLLSFESAKSGHTEVDVLELARVVGDDGVIVDVRANSDYRKGYIPGSINVPLAELNGAKKLKKFKKRPVVLVCGSGQQSRTGVKTLVAEGFEQVRTLKGGLAEWTRENLPLKKA